MLFLADTNDKIQLVSSTAATLDVVAAFIDVLSGAGTPGKQLTAITAADTYDIVGAPSGSNVRTVKAINIRNKHSSLSSDVTVVFDDNGTDYELIKVTLLPGDVLEFVEGIGWFVVRNAATPLINESVAQQGAGFSSDTYLTGSNILIPSGLPVVGTAYLLRFDVVKTAAGTAQTAINVRVGTNGSTADTSRCAFTMGSGTGAADTGVYDILCVFRTVGSGTSAVIQGQLRLTSNLTTTGLSNAVKALQVTGGGFDSTVANLIIGASYNGGASASHTIQLVRAELVP
jgi:hypothetical protein